MVHEVIAWGRKVTGPSGDLLLDTLSAKATGDTTRNTAPEAPQVPRIMFLDLDIRRLPFRMFRYPRLSRVLVVLEPRVVNPLLYKAWFRRLFGTVAVISKTQVVLGGEVVLPFGSLGDLEEVTAQCETTQNSIRESRTIALVNENKFSVVSGSLYKYRSDAIKAFSGSNVSLKLAGRNWDRPLAWHLITQMKNIMLTLLAGIRPELSQLQRPLNFSKLENVSYAGPVDSSVEFMSSAKFALVIENEATYVSEKLFNAILAGCIPVYVGPSLKSQGVPEEVAIQYCGPAEDIAVFVESIQEPLGSFTRSAARDWLVSPETLEKWGRCQTATRLAALFD